MAEEDIVQRVKIVVEDVSFDKAIGDATKKLETGLQKSVSAYSPTIKVNFSSLDKFNKSINATTKSVGTTSKTIDGITTSLSALNAVGTAAVTKQLASAGAATKNLVTQTKQAVVEQKNLNKAIAAVPVARSERDPNTGQYLPPGVKAPPKRGTSEAATFDEGAFKKQVAEARAARKKAETEAARVKAAAPAAPFIPLERDPVTKRFLPRGVKAAAPPPPPPPPKHTASSVQRETGLGYNKAADEADRRNAAAKKQVADATKQATVAQKDLNKTIAAAPEPDKFKAEPRPLSTYAPTPPPSTKVPSPLQPVKPPAPPPPPPPPKNPNRERLDAATKRFDVASEKQFEEIAKGEVIKAVSFLQRITTDTGKPEDIKARYAEELARITAQQKKIRELNEATADQKKKLTDTSADYQETRDQRLFDAFKSRNLGISREQYEARKKLADQQQKDIAGGPTLENRIDEARKLLGRQPVFGGKPLPPGQAQGPDLSGKLRERAQREAERAARGGSAGGGSAVNQLQSSLRALMPILGQAGVSIGGLGPILTAAGAGATALGIAITGGLLVAFEMAGDKVNDAASRLANFAGGAEKGKEAFKELQGLSKTLEVSATGLAKPYEEIVRMSKADIPIKDKTDILKNLVTGAQADRVPEDTMNKVLGDFLAKAREQKFVSEDDIKRLEEVFPKLGAELRKSIEQVAPGQLARGFTPTPTVLEATGRPSFAAGVEARKAEQAAAFPESIGAAFDKLKASTENLAASLAGGKVIATTLAALAKFMDETAKAVDLVKNSKPKQPTGGSEGVLQPGALTPAGMLGRYLGAQAPVKAAPPPPAASPFDKFQQPTLSPGVVDTALQNADSAAVKAAAGMDAFATSADTAAAAAMKIGTATETYSKQLGVHAAGLNKAKAAIDFKFVDRDLASQAAKNSLNVQRADIAVQSAQIGLKEAQKQKELAGMAPEQAKLNRQQAQNTVDQLRSASHIRRLQQMGEDFTPGHEGPQATMALLRKKQAEEESLDLQERAAEQALKRAKIEEKYAHLEPAKAELAGQQAETALRSAEIEKSDALSKEAKDDQGRPIDRDLATVRYLDSILKNDVAAAAVEKEQLSTLQQILKVLTGGDATPNEDASTQDQQGGGSGSSRGGGSGSGRLIENPDGSTFDPATGVTTHPWNKRGGSGGGGSGGGSRNLSGVYSAKDVGGNEPDWMKQTRIMTIAAELDMKLRAANNQVLDQNTKALTQDTKVTAQNTSELKTSSFDPNAPLGPNTQATLDRLAQGEPVPRGGLPLDAPDVQKAITDFRNAGVEIGKMPEQTQNILKALGDRSDQSVAGELPDTVSGINRMLQNQRQLGEVEGQQADQFTKSIDKLVGKPDDWREQERAKQKGIVDSQIGKVDLSERLPGTDQLRFRKITDQNQIPPEKGSYDPYTMSYRAAPNKDQPFPRLQEKAPFSWFPDPNRKSGKFEDVFDMSGRGKANPIYNAGQPQPLFGQQQQNVPLPQARPDLELSGLEAAFQSVIAAMEPLKSSFGDLSQATESAVQSQQQESVADQTKANEALAESTVDTSEKLSSVDNSGSKAADSLASVESAAASLSSAFEQTSGDLENRNTPGYASGGSVHGPGTSTSDSIPAWLSHGEFVQSARATRYWGTDFMRSINSLKIPRFNMGGLAGLMSPQMPRFAEGGFVSDNKLAPAAPYLGTVDLRTDHGSVSMHASKSAVDQLSKLAVTKRITSTGRKPGFIS